jgi:hypothetical protein
LDNLIPLCTACHTAFDKPRTREEYLALVEKKSELIALSEQRRMQYQYSLQDEVSRIVAALDKEDYEAGDVLLAFDAKPVDEKLDAAMPLQLKRKIKRNVNDNFVDVRERFQTLDKDTPGVSHLISLQVRSFYQAQKVRGWSQQQIFNGVTEWIEKRTGARTREAAEIVASFFVQNCEVFE